MIDRINSLMAALQAASSGRPHLGADHPAISARIDECATLLDALLRERADITVYFLADRVAADSLTLPATPELLRGIGRRLASIHADALVFRAGTTRDDIVRLLDALEPHANHSAITAPGARCAVRLISRDHAATHADEAPGDDAPGAEAIKAHAGDLSGAIASIEQGDPLDTGAVERTVAGILTSHQLLPGSLIDLISVRNHDEYTLSHTINVAILSSALGQSLGVAGTPLEDLTIAALLHDVGKQFVSVDVLRKPGALEQHELHEMQRHPLDGARLLLGRTDVPPLAAIVAYEHHRRIDGTGYPERRTPGPPNLASQIVHVCDVFDALCTDRPYRPALPIPDALHTMASLAGKAFDRSLFEVFAEEIAQRVPPRPILFPSLAIETDQARRAA